MESKNHDAANITPKSTADHTTSLRTPRRDEIGPNTVETIVEGLPLKADVRIVDLGQGPFIVKDFAKKAWWSRWAGRIQTSREVKAYEWLTGVDEIPILIGRIDRHALAVEKIDGDNVYRTWKKIGGGPELMEKIRALIDHLHATGFVHLDLQSRENILYSPGGDLKVIDLASGLMFHPGSLSHRLFFPFFAFFDNAGFVRWRLRLDPSGLTEDDRRFLRRFRWARYLWPFNRKRHGTFTWWRHPDAGVSKDADEANLKERY